MSISFSLAFSYHYRKVSDLFFILPDIIFDWRCLSFHLLNIQVGLFNIFFFYLNFSIDPIRLNGQRSFLFFHLLQIALIFVFFVFNACLQIKASSSRHTAYHQPIHFISDVSTPVFISTNHPSSLMLVLHWILQAQITILAIKCVT